MPVFIEMGDGADAFEGIVAACAAGRAREGKIWVVQVTAPRSDCIICFSTGDPSEDLRGRVSEVILEWMTAKRVPIPRSSKRFQRCDRL